MSCDGVVSEQLCCVNEQVPLLVVDGPTDSATSCCLGQQKSSVALTRGLERGAFVQE